ncbi:hypothetical protein [Natrinema sp. H-ect4]
MRETSGSRIGLRLGCDRLEEQTVRTDGTERGVRRYIFAVLVGAGN